MAFLAANGVWGTWTVWGACTESCETGTQTRTRVCDRPAPADGGLTCALPGAETQECNTHMCPSKIYMYTYIFNVSLSEST